MAGEQARPTTCPSCGQVYDPSRTVYCDKCGNRFPWAEGAGTTPSGAAIVRPALSAGAAAVFAWVGFVLVGAPDTLASMMGWFSFGMALLALSIALLRDAGAAN